MAKVGDGFSPWLSSKLKALNVDENIFLSYILSILEGDEPRDEKLDALKSVFCDCASSVNTLFQLRWLFTLHLTL